MIELDFHAWTYTEMLEAIPLGKHGNFFGRDNWAMEMEIILWEKKSRLHGLRAGKQNQVTSGFSDSLVRLCKMTIYGQAVVCFPFSLQLALNLSC